MHNRISLLDKEFELFLDENSIQQRIAELAQTIGAYYKDLNPVIVGVLNGAVFFTADLCKYFDFSNQLTFTKVSSYVDTQSSGQLQNYMPPSIPITDRHILLIEDIIDTGLTLDYLREKLLQEQPLSINTASLLFKPDAFKGTTKPDWIGFSIPNQFVIGYGLDYNGYGRTLRHIYQAV